MKEFRPLLISSYIVVAFIGAAFAQQNIPTADAVLVSTDTAVLSLTTINSDLQAHNPLSAEIITSLHNVSTDDEKYSTSSKWSLGFVYPGVAIKYKLLEESAWEVKAQSDSGVVAAGLRYYHYFNTTSNLSLFCGAEADYMRFKGEVSKGSGFAGGAFIGGETELARQLSLSMDFGPMYISLSDDEFSQAGNGIEYVLNIGIYWHF